MNEQENLSRFTDLHVVRAGHFLRTSGRHADWYVQCARLFEQPETAEAYCRELAHACAACGAQVVMSAAIGGLLAGYEVSRILRLKHIYCERRDGAMTLRRGFSIEKGTRILLIEDEVTTGSSVREMMEIVRALGGETVGIGCIADKSGGRLRFDAPLHALITLDVHSWRENACPLCEEGLPLDSV